MQLTDRKFPLKNALSIDAEGQKLKRPWDLKVEVLSIERAVNKGRGLNELEQ